MKNHGPKIRNQQKPMADLEHPFAIDKDACKRMFQIGGW
jgi:hypothetical protein